MKRKIIFILLSLLQITVVSCANNLDSSKIDESPILSNSNRTLEVSTALDIKHIELNDYWDIKKYNNDSNNKVPLKEWLPDKCNFKGKIELIWSDKRNIDYQRVTRPIPEGWLFANGEKIIDENVYSGIYTPDKGWVEKKVNISGITDGKNVYGFNHRQFPIALMWRLSDGETFGTEEARPFKKEYFIIDSCLVGIFNPQHQYILRKDPNDGQIIWDAETRAYKPSNTLWVANDKNLFVCISFYNEIGQSLYEPVNCLLYKLNPQDCTGKGISIDKKECDSIIAIKSTFWMHFKDETLVEIDANNLNQLRSFKTHKINQLRIFISPKNDGLQSIDSKILFINNEENKYSIFDTVTEKIVDLKTTYAKVINNSLIIEDEEKIKGIDPENIRNSMVDRQK